MTAIYKPGDTVPTSGLYQIDHHSHRLMHEAALAADSRFPSCKQCGNRVRFTLSRAIRGYILPFRSTHFLEEYDDPDSPLAATG